MSDESRITRWHWKRLRAELLNERLRMRTQANKLGSVSPRYAAMEDAMGMALNAMRRIERLRPPGED